MKLRRASWLAVAIPVAVALAACSSSSSSSPSSAAGTSSAAAGSSSSAAASGSLKTGLKVFVIPKQLGNPYFTLSDSVKSGGALAALQTLGETGGTAATAASQIPTIQAAITKGANALLVSATDASALCPTLNSAMRRGITVVTYDSDALTCLSQFIN